MPAKHTHTQKNYKGIQHKVGQYIGIVKSDNNGGHVGYKYGQGKSLKANHIEMNIFFINYDN